MDIIYVITSAESHIDSNYVILLNVTNVIRLKFINHCQLPCSPHKSLWLRDCRRSSNTGFIMKVVGKVVLIFLVLVFLYIPIYLAAFDIFGI